MNRDAIRKKLILEALLECRGNTIKESALLDRVNFDADPPMTVADFGVLMGQLEKALLTDRVANPHTNQMRAGITDDGVVAYRQM